MSILNQFLGGAQGLGQGLAQQRQFRLQEDDKATIDADRRAQTAVREQQLRAATLADQQRVAMGTPEFQAETEKALGGDKAAISRVTARMMSIDHPNAREIVTLINRPAARTPMTTGIGPDGNPVRVADEPGASVYEPPKEVKPPDRITGTDGTVLERQPNGTWQRAAMAGGGAVTTRTPPEVLTPTPGPAGSQVWGPKVEGGVIPQPPKTGKSRTDATYKAQDLTIKNMKDALARYRAALTDTGVEVMPGPKQEVLTGAHANAMLQGKEIAKLGVLAGPDMGILEKMIGDPTSMKSMFLNGLGGRSKALLAGLDQYEAMVDQMKDRLDQTYGGDDSAHPPSGGTKPKPTGGDPEFDALMAKYRKPPL